MTILILGNGGREAALAWKFSQDPSIQNVFIWPSPSAASELSAKIKIAKTLDFELAPDLTIAGSEQFVENGLTDELRDRGWKVFAPTRQAARLETSKSFAKSVMLKAKIPTATAVTFDNLHDSLEYVHDRKFDQVVYKVDELAAGKGVLIPNSEEEKLQQLQEIWSGQYLGFKPKNLLIEERIFGEEISVFYACNELCFSFLGAAQDYKRLCDQDLGPNTGGMGANSYHLIESERLQIENSILRPLLVEMKNQSTPYCGFLYLGLMRTEIGYQVIEFNVRMGDPETQVLVPSWPDEILHCLLKLMSGESANVTLRSKEAIHVVLASEGYPGVLGQEIAKNREVKVSNWQGQNFTVFPAGIKIESNRLLSHAGRVVGVTAWSQQKNECIQIAYGNLPLLVGAQFRKDIGSRWQSQERK